MSNDKLQDINNTLKEIARELKELRVAYEKQSGVSKNPRYPDGYWPGGIICGVDPGSTPASFAYTHLDATKPGNHSSQVLVDPASLVKDSLREVETLVSPQQVIGGMDSQTAGDVPANQDDQFSRAEIDELFSRSPIKQILNTIAKTDGPQPDPEEKYRELVKQGLYVNAVKQVRQDTGVTLIQAKAYIDKLKDQVI